jgi:acyl-coenzyme A thioesterase PaaI-like protein
VWEVRLLSFINAKEQEVRGIEISANHRNSLEGVVTGTARIIHKGRTLHLWEIKLPMKKGI